MDSLGIDYKLIVAQIISFAVFFALFARFISKPLIQYLKTQKEQDELREKMEEELKKRDAILAEKDRAADRERKKAFDAALEESKKEGLMMKESIIAQAKKDAEALIVDTKKQLQIEREEMSKEIRANLATLSILLVEKALKDYLTPQVQKELTQHIISQVPKMKIEV